MSSDHIWPILFFVSLAGNLILLFYRPLLRLLRRGEEVSEDEIMAMVEEGEESGAIERNEKELIENVFEFNNTTAEDVMIHRTDMVTLSLDDDEETILSAIRESGLSRFPVYQGNVDDRGHPLHPPVSAQLPCGTSPGAAGVAAPGLLRAGDGAG